MLDVRTHEVVRGNPTPHGNSLQCCVLDLLDSSSNDRNIQQLLMHMPYYFACGFTNHVFFPMAILLSHNSMSLEDISKTYNALICLISLNIYNNINPVSSIVYGDRKSQVTKYVCILNNIQEQRYEPLYVVNKNNQKEKETIFNIDDETARKMLEDFIFDTYKHNINLQF